jgi:hypothetical protein
MKQRPDRATSPAGNTASRQPTHDDAPDAAKLASDAAAEPEPSPPPVAEAPPGTPLVLDLRDAAARAEKGGFGSMADKARTSLGDEHQPQEGRVARSFGRARKADCLASNEHGSLLSIFKIAYDALTDRCK